MKIRSYKKGQRPPKCEQCGIVLVERLEEVEYWYGTGGEPLKLVKLQADGYNSWNGVDKLCDHCINLNIKLENYGKEIKV